MVQQFNRKLILETGEEYYGFGFGAEEDRVCEVVFNTSMVGYQEIVSDLSNAHQAVVMTYPLIGNYGIADDDYESRTPSLGALIVREYNDQPSNFRYTKTLGEVLEECHIPAIAGLDTRKLTRSIRDNGSCRALITDADTTVEDGLRIIAETPVPTDVVAEVSCRKRWYSRTSNHKYNVVAVDCGIKLSLIRNLNARGCNVTVVPYDTPAEVILQMNPDGVLISDGPGNPEDVRPVIELVKQLRGKFPIFGVCLGHQIIALASGAKVSKLKAGHRGSNHAIRNLATGKLEFASQNHSYVVDADSLEGTNLTITHVNLLDNTIEGLACPENHIFGVQYQPDGASATEDSAYLFDQFIDMMKEAQPMPKRTDIHKILVIGSGPIVIGQAAEFDYAGTQACLALKEEGYEVILVNSNPATIMTDTSIADKVYMEPLTLEFLSKICRYERPDAIVPGIGGQTGLNLAMQLQKKGVLEECQVELLGTSSESIEMAEDREMFKELCERLGEPVLPSVITHSIEEGVQAANEIGYPVVLRPAFTLGGTGGGFADDEEELREIMKNALKLSPVGQVLVEKSIKGFKEIEYEVMRDKNDTALVICNMENIDPVGIHTGDSIVVAPSQTLTRKECHLLRDSALKIIRALKIEGGCNVQFALDPESFKYYLIEVNPRVSRSSALASKASGFPIARVSAKIATGMTLDEIRIANTPACFEPTLDYVVTKMARFPFDKFANASNHLSTQMKATGEVMSIGRTLEESILKAVRSLEIGVTHLRMKKFDATDTQELLDYISIGTDDRLFAIAELIRRDVDLGVILSRTQIDMLFLDKVRNIVLCERMLAARSGDVQALYFAKRMGFADKTVAELWKTTEDEIFALRKREKMFPVYKMMDTCAAEFDGYISYFYATYESENESVVSDRKKIVVLGSGPIRIGQGVEFDYSTVHAIKTIKASGYEAIIINNNPETVSTDYTTSDKLYFEPLTTEDVMNILELEKPVGVIASLGGQTAINLAGPLTRRGVKIIGTDMAAIEKAENRDAFEKVLKELNIPQPRGEAVTNIEDGVRVASEIGYPVLVRPSYVLGGRAMQIVAGEGALRTYLKNAVQINEDQPVLVDKYIIGKELEVDAVCDGCEVFVPGVMELVERTGIHSGDSISVYPTFSVSSKVKGTILEYTKKLGLGIGIVGLYNIQFIVDRDENVYVIEVNPRSSRTVPFLSKATGYSLADIATLTILGKSLKEQGFFEIYPEEKKRWYVKVPAFSFSKLSGMDNYLSPEMKSTGEAIGYDSSLTRALYKALTASGTKLVNYGTIFVTIADGDKEEALPLIRRFYNMGFNIEATRGTARFLKEHGIRTRMKLKLSDGSEEILEGIRKGYVTYVINTREYDSSNEVSDGYEIRRCASENNVTVFTALDTVRVLLDVLEETTMTISTINGDR